MLGKVTSVHVSATLRGCLVRGHPWVYRNQILELPDLPSGAWVQVRCGDWTAYGLWDAASAIAVRLFSRHSVPDAQWVADRVAAAWDLRAPIRVGPTTAYRWIFGESDGLPGIVVDLYGEFAVIGTFVEAVEGLVPWVADALHAHCFLRGILWRATERDPEALWGKLPPPRMTVEEHGLLFAVDLLAGQKTGFFLDQRENRRTLARWCRDRTVLDCFCYTGAFSAYAARGGAASITACDSSAAAVESARHNLSLNGLDSPANEFLVGDCFDLLKQFSAQRRQFDVVILDPPSLAHDRQQRHAAQRAYRRLNQMAMRCVKPGGLLASASCTGQVSPELFRQILSDAAHEARSRLLIVHEVGQSIDHPVPAHFPEARYLKFVIGRVLSVP